MADIAKIVVNGTQYDIKDANARYTFDGTYNASTNKAATVSTVTNAINALDGTLSGSAGSGKTLTAFSQTNGKVSATFGDISITKSQVSDFPTSMTPASHTHGNIQNGGTLQTTDVAIASGDKLVVTDSSNSSKIARTSLSFDGSTTTKALTQKGTFETFLQSHQSISGKKNTQSAVSDPTASGTSLTFISGISQNAQGVISPAKKTVATMGGSTASAAGTAGLVPAPAAGDQEKVLTGAGTWQTPVGSRVLVVSLDDVSNASGSYTHTTTVTGMTSDLKAVAIECSDPTIFKDAVTITTATDSVTLACSDVAGSSTVKVSFLAVGNANPLSSTEYAALDARIGDLSDLTTTDKTSVVDAVNEVNNNFKWVRLLQPTSISNDASAPLSDSIENYNEIYVQLHVYVSSGTYSRACSIILPVDAIKAYGYGSQNQFIVSAIGSVMAEGDKLNYAEYAQISFTNPTTLMVNFREARGWSGTCYFTVYAR